MQPWLDYSGRLSPLKLLVFAALFLPGGWTALALATGQLGADPIKEALHELGLWAIRFLLIALAITPARAVLQWPRLMLVRRMLGVAAFAYAAAHLLLYVADEAFDLAKVASEIVLRLYLTIGFVALLGLTALTATSTDGMVRRLGAQRWQRLHQLAYVIAALGLIHYFIQSKLEVYEPMVMDGFFLWLMGYRLLARRRRDRRMPLAALAALGLAAAALTALGEAVYYWLKTGVDPSRVLGVNLSLATGIRPGMVVLAAGAAVTVLAALRAPAGGRRGTGHRDPRPAPQVAASE
ncbi:MAG TPA: protein-methionine-sulfoxide reductase heme-binding subunit MsrQ [Stellaceae bacterium]|jgi:sulfoxide reductase heme-binding subunit YedZ|nr:protein-methionine-sulfoxide reductase heme-binding subunit MsrQ [Stellaceae bacterium]